MGSMSPLKFTPKIKHTNTSSQSIHGVQGRRQELKTIWNQEIKTIRQKQILLQDTMFKLKFDPGGKLIFKIYKKNCGWQYFETSAVL